MSLSNDIFGFDTKSKGNKSKSKWDYIILKRLCTAKETNMKTAYQMGENTLTIYLTRINIQNI